MAEEHECGICYELLHQPVQLAPCLHIFCGGCLSDWFKKQQDCPNCRKEVKTVTKSFQALTMIQMLIGMKPELKRADEVVKELEAKNIFKTDIHEVKPQSQQAQQAQPSVQIQNIFGQTNGIVLGVIPQAHPQWVNTGNPFHVPQNLFAMP